MARPFLAAVGDESLSVAIVCVAAVAHGCGFLISPVAKLQKFTDL